MNLLIYEWNGYGYTELKNVLSEHAFILMLFFTSMEDAAEKATFYLVHDNFRRKIAINGFRKAQQEFSFEKKLAYLFDKAKH